MAELATLARPYANAAFDTALTAGSLAGWSRALALLAEAAQQPEIAQRIKAPALTAAAKAETLEHLLEGEGSAAVGNFVRLLAINGRLLLLPEISAQFEQLKAEQEKVLDVEIVSAFELEDAQVQGISDALKRRFASDVSVATRVDTDLLGGVLVRAGDTVIDGTVRGRLDKLRETLARG